MAKQQVNFRLPKELLKAVDDAAKDQGRTRNNLVETLLKLYTEGKLVKR